MDACVHRPNGLLKSSRPNVPTGRVGQSLARIGRSTQNLYRAQHINSSNRASNQLQARKIDKRGDMKRVTLGLLMLALVVPVSAEAKKPPKKPTPAQQSATKNAAWMCKSLRAANPTAFRLAFGKNTNARNAYGKCVSAHARAKSTDRIITLKKLTINATGTVTNAGASGCQFSVSGCTLSSSGNLTGVVGGTYTSTLTIMWTQATSNGQGGFCAPASGQTTLTLPGLGTITKQETGQVCEVGVTGTNVAHTFSGTFTVSGGTGLFSNATGSGTATFSQSPGASSALGGAITASETFTTLSVQI